MKIGFETGYYEDYWEGWPWREMYGGSERIVVEVATALASRGHSVTVRLPRPLVERVWRGVRWIGLHAERQEYDALFLADCYSGRDHGVRRVLVACRSDPPPHKDFDQRIYLSRAHAELMGDPSAPYVGGGVDLADYSTPKKRIPRRVITTSSPDRCPLASRIGADWDFVHTYRPVGNVGHEYTRAELIELQQTAMVHSYPYEPSRESDFYGMSVLESMAAGTPVIVSDGPALVECWGDTALVLERPVRLAEWHDAIEWLMTDKKKWKRMSELGQKKAADLTWEKQAARYLAIAMERQAEAA